MAGCLSAHRLSGRTGAAPSFQLPTPAVLLDLSQLPQQRQSPPLVASRRRLSPCHRLDVAVHDACHGTRPLVCPAHHACARGAYFGLSVHGRPTDPTHSQDLASNHHENQVRHPTSAAPARRISAPNLHSNQYERRRGYRRIRLPDCVSCHCPSTRRYCTHFSPQPLRHIICDIVLHQLSSFEPTRATGVTGGQGNPFVISNQCCFTGD